MTGQCLNASLAAVTFITQPEMAAPQRFPAASSFETALRASSG
jgi:hypothetical protein